MTDYIFSNLSNGATLGFDVASDVLIFGSINASDLSFTSVTGGLRVTSGGKSVTLTGVTIGQLTTTNVSVAGAAVVVGDNTTATDLDDLAQGAGGVLTTAPGTGNDYILGLGGNDAINGQDGNDFINGGQGADTVTVDADEGLDTIRGGADADSLNGGSATEALIVYGDNGADSVEGGTAADFLQGNAGNDSIFVDAIASGADTARGGQGDDIINYSSATAASSGVRLFGDAGNDTITASNNAATGFVIEGGEGTDSIVGGAGAESILGGAGSDTIGDGALADTIRGGQGGDSITLAVGDAVADLAYGDLGDDTIAIAAGDSGADTIFGGQGNDSINVSVATTGVNVSGDLGDDTILVSVNGGTEGSHTVSGGGGSDTFTVYLDNGGNNQTYYISDFVAGTDSIALTTDDLDASDLALTNAIASLTSSTLILEDDATGGASNDERLEITTSGSGTITVTDAAGTDTSYIAFNNTSTGVSLTGGTGDDLFLSLEAGDTITTGDGADFGSLGAGNDVVIQNTTGTDTVIAGTGDDTLTIAGTTQVSLDGGAAAGTGGHAGFESIGFSGTGTRSINFAATYVTAGDIAATDTVTINGASYASAITIADGADAGVKLNITGGSSGDNIVLNAITTSVTIVGGDGGDTITSNSAADSLDGGAGADTLTSGADADTVSGGDSADSIDAGAGIDSVSGGAGSDTILGGTGADTLSGGDGADYYYYTDDDQDDVIAAADFTISLDVIALSGTDAIFAGGTEFKDSNGATDITTLAAGVVTVFDVARNGGTVDATAADNEVIKLTDVTQSTFANAIGTTEITVSNLGTDVIALVWYDLTNGQAVIGHVVEGSGTDNAVDAADAFTEITRVTMSTTDYANLDTDNFAFLA